MSLQSSEIKLAGAMLLKVLTLKKLTFNANRVTGDPKNISRTAKEIIILPLAYCYRPSKEPSHKKLCTCYNHRAYES